MSVVRLHPTDIRGPRKPLGLNSFSPLARGHVASALFFQDPVGIGSPASEVGGLTKTANPFGLFSYSDFTNNTDYCEWTGGTDRFLISDMTLSAWINIPGDKAGYATIANFQTSSNTTRRFWWGIKTGTDRNNAFGFTSGGSSRFINGVGDVIPAGEFVHLAMTFIRPDFKAFINGVQTGATTTFDFSPDVSPTTQPRIGDTVVEPNLAFHGDIISVSVWNRALADNEIWALYDPQTRWSLFQPPNRRKIYKVPAAGSVTPQFYHQRFHNRAA